MKRIKNGLFTALLLAATLGLTGCLNVLEEITFNRNGSGSYSLLMDMSGMMSMMKDMDLGKMLGGEGDDQNEGGEEKVEKEPQVRDETFTFAEMMTERGTDLSKLDKPEFWKKVKMRTNINEPKGIMEITMFFDFDDVSEVKYFQENLGSINGEEGAAAGMGGMGGMMSGITGTASDILFKNRNFSRKTKKQDAPKMDDEMEQQMQMVKMFMANASYKTVYHFPRKVKSTTFNGATISDDGKTVTLEKSVLDVMEDNTVLDGTVKMKRR